MILSCCILVIGRKSNSVQYSRMAPKWDSQGQCKAFDNFLGDLAFITAPDATAVLDCHDPNSERITDLLGYRSDPTSGLAYRVLTFEYEDDIGETLLFRLFSPDRVQEATIGTGWTVEDISRNSGENSYYY